MPLGFYIKSQIGEGTAEDRCNAGETIFFQGREGEAGIMRVERSPEDVVFWVKNLNSSHPAAGENCQSWERAVIVARQFAGREDWT